MKQLEKDFMTVARDLKRLIQKTEKMIKQLEKVQAAKKPKAKAIRKAVAKKATKATATDTVLAIIKRSRKGVDKATLINKTGFKDNNIRAILYRLRKQGKIKSERKGIYVNA